MNRGLLRGVCTAGLLVLVACSAERPEARRVDAIAEPSVAPPQTIGANVVLKQNEVVSPDRSATSLTGDTSVEERAMSASKDLIPAFFHALKSNDLVRAASYASGNALSLIDAMQQQAACDFRVSDAGGAVPTNAATSTKLSFVTNATGFIRFSNGVSQQVTSVSVAQARSGSFLIDDLSISGSPLASFLQNGPKNGRLENDLRIFTTTMCIGASGANASFRVINETEWPINPSQVTFVRPDGSIVPLAGGVDTILARPIQPGGQATWTVSLRGDRLVNGSLVTTAPDPSGEAGRGVIDRRVPFQLPPLFGATR